MMSGCLVTRTSGVADFQNRKEGFLRNFDTADLLHALLALFLLLEELAFTRDVAAVTLRRDVLADRLDRFARDDAAADRCLQCDFEHLSRNQLAQLLDDRAAIFVRLVAMDDHTECVDRFAIYENVEADEVVRAVLE